MRRRCLFYLTQIVRARLQKNAPTVIVLARTADRGLSTVSLLFFSKIEDEISEKISANAGEIFCLHAELQ